MSKEQDELRDALRKIKKLVCGDKAPRWANDDAVFDTRGIIADICEIADMPRASLANEGVQELVTLLEDLKGRIDDIREDMLNATIVGGENRYSVDEWSLPIVNMKSAITLITVGLAKYKAHEG
jgi:hypothetical protein